METALKAVSSAILRALVTWFGMQVANSAGKLAEGKIGTAEESERDETLQYPSLTMCPFVLGGGGEGSVVPTLTSERPVAEELLSLEQENFVDSDAVKFKGISDNGDGFKGLNDRGILSVKMSSLGRLPVRCINYNPPGKSTIGFEGKIRMFLNATGFDLLVVYVHNRGTVNLSLNREYGSTFCSLVFKEEFEKDALFEHHYEIERTKWSLARTHKMPCSSDERADCDVLSCVYSGWEESMGCGMPWRTNSDKRLCNTSEEYDEIIDKLMDFKESGEREIGNKYGCLASCSRFSYSLKEFRGKKGTIPDSLSGSDVIVVNFIILDPTYTTKVQYAVYDHNNLIADIGGYLGLLLGQSILTFYDLVVEWIVRRK